MKTLTMILILMSYYRNVNSVPLFEFITTPLVDLASSLTASWRHVMEKIKNRFFKNVVQTFRHDNFEDGEKNEQQPSTEPVTESYTKETTKRMSIIQLAKSHDRKIDTHVVLTNDGYLLNLHRITPTMVSHMNNTHRTVILHHGLLGSATDWILPGPNESLPYLLFDGGYDVWMTNARGNHYSRSHYSLNVNSKEFWNFSWQEMGEYDLPAVIDYIRRSKNSSETIDYVGHSMGATALLVLLSTKPYYNQYLRMGILLAPLAFLTNIRGPIKNLASVASNPPDEIIDAMGRNEFIPFNNIPDLLTSQYCNEQKMFCSNPLFFLSGGIPRSDAWKPSFVSSLFHNVPAGGSTRTILHYAQVAHSRKFHRFGNVDSEFPLSQVTLPIVLFSSGGDWLAPISDVLKLYFSLGHPLAYFTIKDRNLTHTEFVWGPDVQELVFNRVIEFLESGLKLNSMKNNDVNSETIYF